MAVTNFEADVYIASTSSKMPGAYGMLMHVASGLFSWSTAAGLLTLSKPLVCTYNQSCGPLSASHNLLYLSFLSESSGRRMPPAERSALSTRLLPQINLCLSNPGPKRPGAKDSRAYLRQNRQAATKTTTTTTHNVILYTTAYKYRFPERP